MKNEEYQVCLSVLKQNIFSPLVWAAVGVNVFGVWEFSSLLKCCLADFHVELSISEHREEKMGKPYFSPIKITLFFLFCLRVCSQVSCPYSEINLNKEGLLPDRLSGERPLALCGPQPRGRRPDQNTNATAPSSSMPDRQEGAEESQSRFATKHTVRSQSSADAL